MNTSIAKNITDNQWIFQSVILMTISGLGFISNCLVIIVIWKTKKLHNATHYLISNLALTDMLVANSSMDKAWLIIWIHTVSQDLSAISEVCCKVSAITMFVSYSASNNTLIALSIERYSSIKRPLKHHLSMHKLKIIIFVIWSISTFIGLPQIYTTAVVGKFENKCFIPKIGGIFNSIYFTILALVLYVIPLITMGIIYTYIGRYAINSTMPGEQSNDAKILYQKRNHRVARNCFIITVLYMVSTLPLAVNFFIIAFGNRFGKKLPFTDVNLYFFSQIAQMVYLLSSIYNPIMYNCLSKDFRKAVLDVFCKNLSQKKRNAIENRITKWCL
ncbi:Substance-K receptor [Trichoplax sp. H2]|nr:Substance-K receptor [Trichoplax sp. H2]|eukprot:RDD40931.1 Substance-K receptor [Trichoplax sp. H2]